IEGRPPASRDEVVTAILETASPNYLHVLNVGLLDGRMLADGDGDGTLPVCLVSESLVRRYFGKQNPLGHKIRINNYAPNEQWMPGVGFVRDVRYSWMKKQISPTTYRSSGQSPRSSTTFLLRPRGSDPSRLAPAARAAIADLDPNLPLYNVKPFDRVILESI